MKKKLIAVLAALLALTAITALILWSQRTIEVDLPERGGTLTIHFYEPYMGAVDEAQGTFSVMDSAEREEIFRLLKEVEFRRKWTQAGREMHPQWLRAWIPIGEDTLYMVRSYARGQESWWFYMNVSDDSFMHVRAKNGDALCEYINTLIDKYGNGTEILPEEKEPSPKPENTPPQPSPTPEIRPQSAYLYYGYGGDNPKRYDLSEEELSGLWAQYCALEFSEGEAPDSGEAWNVCFVFGADSLYFSMDEAGRSTEGQCDAPEAFLECVKSLYLGRRDLQKSPEDVDAAIACVRELLPTAEIWYEPSASTEAAEDYLHKGGGVGRDLSHEDVIAVFSRENTNDTEVTRKIILIRTNDAWTLADFGLHPAELNMDYDLAERFK